MSYAYARLPHLKNLSLQSRLVYSGSSSLRIAIGSRHISGRDRRKIPSVSPRTKHVIGIFLVVVGITILPVRSSLCEDRSHWSAQFVLLTLSLSANARSRGDPYPARGRGLVRAPGAALFDRQGFERAAAPRAQGLLSRRKPPFPLLHVDTTWKFRDMIRFRDDTAKRLALDLLVVYVTRRASPAASIRSAPARRCTPAS